MFFNKKYEPNIGQFSETQLHFYKRLINYCEINGLALPDKQYERFVELCGQISVEQTNFKFENYIVLA